MFFNGKRGKSHTVVNVTERFIGQIPNFLLVCLCCLQISVEAPWLSNIPSNCAVIGKGMLTCVDPATQSLYMLDLHVESQMTQIPFQVSTEINQNLFVW